jgi:polyhydroxyalkanoate synthesis repressor PhaR
LLFIEIAPSRNVAVIAALQHNHTAPAKAVKRKMKPVMERKPVLIKKYENRRLYDSTSSRYVNLEEVAQMVQEGREVQVLDAATGEDLTRLVLTQIIMEQAKTPGSAFPLDILRQMVAATNRAGQETALSYAKAMFDLYQSAYRSLPTPLNPFGLVPLPARPAEGESAMPAPEKAERNGQLQRRVEELESLVARLETRRPARRAKPKARRKR